MGRALDTRATVAGTHAADHRDWYDPAPDDTPHQPRARAPQPPAGGQLRACHRRQPRRRVPAHDRGAGAPPRASASACTTRGRCWSGCAASGPRPWSGWRRSTSAARWRSWAAAGASRCSRRCRNATASASCDAWPASLPRRSASDHAAHGSRSGSGSRTCPPRSTTRAMPGPSSTTRTSGSAGIADDAMWGPYSTDDQGRRINVFGTEQGLRYRIPFGTVESVIEHLRTNATEDGERLGVMGDDGEKFGAWPTTWDHCWGPGERVGGPVLRCPRREPRLADDHHAVRVAGAPAAGRAHLPAHGLVRRDGRVVAATRRGPALLGGAPRGHRRGAAGGALDARRLLAQLPGQVPRDQRPPQADAPDIRRGRGTPRGPGARRGDRPPVPGPVQRLLLARRVRGHLPLAHAARDPRAPHRRPGHRRPAGPRAGAARRRHPLARCGPRRHRRSWSSPAPASRSCIKPSEGAGIGTWDIRASRHALASVLRRRPEAYHAKLVEFEAGGGGHAGARAMRAASIHDIVKVREPGLAARLHYDRYERRSGLVHILGAGRHGRGVRGRRGPRAGRLRRWPALRGRRRRPTEVRLERASGLRRDRRRASCR